MLRMMNDNVLVKLLTVDVTPGGIVLPDNRTPDIMGRGLVVGVGNGKLNDKGVRMELPIRTGDEVWLHTNYGTEMKIDGENYWVTKMANIHGVVES